MRPWRMICVVASALVWSACGGPTSEQDAGGGPADGGVDAASADAGSSGGVDAGSSGGPDLGAADMGQSSGEDMGQASTEDMGSTSACATPCAGETPVCDEGSGACVGCLAASDCDEGAECDLDTNTCQVPVVTPNPDLNGDGELNILIIGTSDSIAGDPFAPGQIATELQSILEGDADVALTVNVVAEDIYDTKPVLLGLGGSGTEYTWPHARHSLAQYYYWPDGAQDRLDNLAGQGATAWDHVVIGADPHIVANLPGYYALGANTVAERVAEGGAQPHLLMTWPRDLGAVDHFVEHTRRVSERARVALPVLATASAWGALPDASRDASRSAHPTPNGAYLAAASVYSSLYARAADASTYTYDDALAQAAHAAQLAEVGRAPYALPRAFVSPFKGVEIIDRVLSYNHTGTSSERGILSGLRWVMARARVELKNGGTDPISFNYGRANTNFEPNKRYQVDPSRFVVSMGFPMQDHSNYGDESMLYGLDYRLSSNENGTDLGVARYMVDLPEIPDARAVPVRTLYARMKQLDPTQSAYRDGWHMSRDLDKAIGSFMYTLLTGHCALDAEPADTSSAEWSEWLAHKVGYETAWTVMHLSGVAPCFKVLPESVDSVSVTPTQTATLEISFMGEPSEDVTVTLSSSDDAVVTYSPKTLVFTPQNHDVPQTVTLTGVAGQPAGSPFVLSATTASGEIGFDGLVERWRYTSEQD